ncbi:MAG: AI-2E family transporter [Paracoccaceae bacterium]
MALPIRDQFKYWGISALALLAVLWLLGGVLLPFILGGAIAYFLDPLADRLEKIGLNRVLATITITLFAVIIFVLAALLVIPTLVQQTADLVQSAPQIVQDLRGFLVERYPSLLDNESRLYKSLVSIGDTVQSRGGELLNGLLNSAAGLINVLVLLVLVPVVTFYLLLDWDRLVGHIDRLLPRDHAPAIRALARDVDRTLAAFIRGQGTVCLVLGAYYAIALMLIGLKFGLVVGFTAGLISFIPYVGALFGGALALGLALFQFWGQWVWVGGVAAIFLAGQFFEGNILTPKLVGGSIGLHPVWLLFALTAFGTLFGFVGLLVAVPVAAAIGVVTRAGLAKYQKSRLFQGVSERSED